MAQKLQAALPQVVDLDAGWQILFRAVDKDSGADVAGVTITNVTLRVAQLTPGGPDALQFGPFMLVPGPGA